MSDHKRDQQRELMNKLTNQTECDESFLSKIFFSMENIDIINKMIVMEVFNNTNKKYLINFQDEKNLMLVMQYVWSNYARNLESNIKDQVRCLNKQVLNEVMEDIMTFVKQQEDYIRFISSDLDPISLPENTRTRLNQELPSMSELFHK